MINERKQLWSEATNDADRRKWAQEAADLRTGLRNVGYSEDDIMQIDDAMFTRAETDALARATVTQMALQVGDEMLTEVSVILTIDTGGATQAGNALSKAWRWAKGLVKGESKVVVDFTYDAAKIGKQMGKRGWTDESIAQALNNPTKTVATRDTRWLPKAAAPLDDPATAYYYKNGGYVVRNNRTGEITQISNRNDLNWIAPWD